MDPKSNFFQSCLFFCVFSAFRDAPEVRLEGIPVGDLEEGSPVMLRCIVDSNPPATVRWKAQDQKIVSTIDLLQFHPVKRRDSGTYFCEAHNEVGHSAPLSAFIDVKFAPRIRKVGPTRLTTAPLYSDTTFLCEAEGNPPPIYQWLQRVPSAPDTLFARGNDARLRIGNISYDHQGDYICKVTNSIAGTDRTVESEPITIQVIGAPQVLRHTGPREVLAVRGEEALLSLVVCADPRPRRAAWEWGSEFVETGKSFGRFKAELLEDEQEDCYQAKLHVSQTEPGDSRSYYLHVENDKGADRHPVLLTVREPMWTTTLLSMMHHEPVPMTTLLSIAAACLLIFLLCVFVAIYVVRREKCCFSRRSDFRPTDLESEKSDLHSDIGRKPVAPVIHSTPGITSETLYSAAPGRRSHIITHGGASPEAMKPSPMDPSPEHVGASTDRLVPQHHTALDGAITQSLFDERGNIAPRRNNTYTLPCGGGRSSRSQRRHRKSWQLEESANSNGRIGGTYYTSTVRVEPMYMSSPYQPPSMDRADI